LALVTDEFCYLEATTELGLEIFDWKLPPPMLW